MSEFVVRCINCAEGYGWAVCSRLDNIYNNGPHKWTRPYDCCEDPQVLVWTRAYRALIHKKKALQAQLNAFCINYSSYKSEEWESLRSSACWDKKTNEVFLFTNSQKHRWHVLPKNIFIIKAGYNKEFPDSMIDYKQWNSTPECIWGVYERESWSWAQWCSGNAVRVDWLVSWYCLKSFGEIGRSIESSITQTMWWGRALWGVTTASAQWTVCSDFTWELRLTHQLLIKD